MNDNINNLNIPRLNLLPVQNNPDNIKGIFDTCDWMCMSSATQKHLSSHQHIRKSKQAPRNALPWLSKQFFCHQSSANSKMQHMITYTTHISMHNCTSIAREAHTSHYCEQGSVATMSALAIASSQTFVISLVIVNMVKTL